MASYEKDFDLTKHKREFITHMASNVLGRKLTDTELDYHATTTNDNRLKLNEFIQSNEALKILKNKLLVSSRNNKKYAIQISGHMRNLKLNKWKNFLDINKNYIDVFIHTWFGAGRRSNNVWINDSDNCEININEIINIYRPKAILIENSFEYLDIFSIYNNDKTCEVYYNSNPLFTDDGDFSRYIVSQLYSIYKVNQLRNNYETLKNIKYDFVFRIRGDTFVNIKIDELTTLNNNNILYINSENHFHALYGRGCAACCYEFPNKNHMEHANLVCDIFYYGSPIVIDKVSSIYLHIMELLRSMEKFNKKQRETGKYNDLLIKHKYTGYGVKTLLAEDLIFKCIYPERLIAEFMKNEFLLTDPLRHYVELK